MCAIGELNYDSELSGFLEWITDDLVTPQLKIRDNHAKTPERVGLGVELDEEKIGKWSVRTIMCE